MKDKPIVYGRRFGRMQKELEALNRSGL
jgi:hypothetical protein